MSGSNDIGEAAGILLIALVVIALAAALGGWFTMLAVGILAANGVVGGTLGFWSATAVYLLLFSVFSSTATVRASRSK